jgi:ribosome maturation factor RimP
MITKERILELAQEHLKDSPRFLVELKLTSDNQIEVFIDGDENVSIDECVDLSRHIEFSLDRETEDFALSVSSAGLDLPLKFIRQYPKYIGENFLIKLKSGEQLLVRLEKVSEQEITVVPLGLNPNAKKGTQKKYIQGTPLNLTLDLIEESKIEITF